MNTKHQKGVASIEFVMGFLIFWFICMAWVEMSYMSYISSISDLIVSESARESKKEESDYLKSFHDTINSNQSLWGGVIDPHKFTLSIQYLDNVTELGNLIVPCMVPDGSISIECGDSRDKAIAIYRIDYSFSSIFSYFFNTESIFRREVIVIQEYERDEFEV
ncbi:pilus assembly protein TadE [Aliivibrio fischeri]|uniref:pilus assembly protein TadE n=1 Tax=Aliivibrio fischeri TaxID=668 RepID=UPI00084C221D|nr:pilus assembly protein TadE [Aliivibrio fischeri]OED58176.1 pilus assembly protein TadE [Aliivibrio fischeri]